MAVYFNFVLDDDVAANRHHADKAFFDLAKASRSHALCAVVVKFDFDVQKLSRLVEADDATDDDIWRWGDFAAATIVHPKKDGVRFESVEADASWLDDCAVPINVPCDKAKPDPAVASCDAGELRTAIAGLLGAHEAKV